MADGFGNVEFRNWRESEFTRIRKAPALEEAFHEMGFAWAEALNTELHAAQAKRKQEEADGYDYHVHDEPSRLRLYMVASTARGQAHEAKHHSILKHLPAGVDDVKVRKPDKPNNPRTHTFGVKDES